MLYTNLSIDRKNLYQLDFLNIYYECDTSLEVLQVPLQAFIFSEFLFFFFFFVTQVVYCMEKTFFRLSARSQRYKWYVTKSVNETMTIFHPGRKKKEQEIFCLRMWACIFRVK